ncbi:MAG: hypothetical protein H0V10_07555 [Geodermatophilaceae bacterium]|nr:hypothetical protein [Geodermatophilaceae bacterium]
MALIADTVSITVMEIVDNAFLLTVPVNRVMIDRGLGHAVVHQYHHG